MLERFCTWRETRTLATPSEVQAYVRRHLRWNMGVGIVDAMFYQVAQQIMSNETVIPLLLSSLGASTVIIGLATALVSLGVLLPQLAMAGLTEGLRYKKPISLLSGSIERASFFLVGVALLLWGQTRPGFVLVLFLVLRTVGSISLGMILPAWSSMIGKVIPTRRRGQFFGIGRSLGALLGVGGAFLAGQLLQHWGFNGFAACMMLGSAATFVSWTGLALTREPPDLEVKPPTPLTSYLARLPELVRKDRNYARFVLARTVGLLGSMATSFVIVDGARRFNLTGLQVGGLTATIAITQTVMYLTWGLIADRYGHKAVLALCALATGLGALLAGWTPVVWGLHLALALVGAAHGGEVISGSNLVLEFARPVDRPTYIGLTATLLAPARTLAPVIGGALAGALGFGPLFAIATALGCLGALMLATLVRDPRTTLADAD